MSERILTNLLYFQVISYGSLWLTAVWFGYDPAMSLIACVAGPIIADIFIGGIDANGTDD